LIYDTEGWACSSGGEIETEATYNMS
jgi:hypothetical protein